MAGQPAVVLDRDAILYKAVPAGFIRRTDFGKKSDFIFGSGTSAFQVEGANNRDGRGECIWDNFARENNLFAPYGEDAVCHYDKYEEDVKIMKNIGFDAYRFSISWSRILPNGKKDNINRKGIDFYHKLLDKLEENKIEPFVTLFHFDTPQALEEEYGGFLDEQITDHFADYADVCFQAFGNRVKYWTTINEPHSYVYGGYVEGTHAPGHGSVPNGFSSLLALQPQAKLNVNDSMFPPSRFFFRTGWQKRSLAESMLKTLEAAARDPDPEAAAAAAAEAEDLAKQPYTVAHNLLLAHAKAVKKYREYKETNRDVQGQIGIVLVVWGFEPFVDVEEYRKAKERATDFQFGWFMNPLVNGEYPENMSKFVTKGHLPEDRMKKDKELIQGSYDFIGLNYYTTFFVCQKDDSVSDRLEGKSRGNYKSDQKIHTQYKDKEGNDIGEEKGAGGWLYGYPKGIKDVLLYVKEKYGKADKDLTIYITENGFDDPDDGSGARWKSFFDRQRISYLHDHLSFLLNAKNECDKDIEKRLKVKGYFVWSLLDNFEWNHGFNSRFGIIYVDYDDGGKRYPKLSARWLKHLLEN